MKLEGHGHASAALELQLQCFSGRGAVYSIFPPTHHLPSSLQPAHNLRLQHSLNTHPPSREQILARYSNFPSLFAFCFAFHSDADAPPPLSLHPLTLALNGALAARRYAALHLLALRFGNGEGLDDSERGRESYWNDVRAVMALLTSSLANATAPLIDALDAAKRERLRMENPTPTSHSRSSSTESPIRTSPSHHQEQRRRRLSSHLTSFAPLPSHLTRFAAHVDALTNALTDARDLLESCVASLRDDTSTSTTTNAATNSAHTHTHHDPTQNVVDPPALLPFERLRHELGLALRECERGRGPLLELLRPPFADEDDEEDWVPSLGLDAEKSELG